MALPLGSRVEIECEAITTAAASTRQVVVPGVPNLFSAAVVGGQDRVVWVAGQLSFKDGALHGSNIEEQTTGKYTIFKRKRASIAYMESTVDFQFLFLLPPSNLFHSHRHVSPLF